MNAKSTMTVISGKEKQRKKKRKKESKKERKQETKKQRNKERHKSRVVVAFSYPPPALVVSNTASYPGMTRIS